MNLKPYWKIGDRAMCVDGRPGEVSDGTSVHKGVIYLVHAVFVTAGGRTFIAVTDHEAREEAGWSQSRFRRIVPACDQLYAHPNFWEERA